MPQTKSVTKALRASRRKRIYNLRTRRKYKTAVKSTQHATCVAELKTAQEILPEAYKQLDLAAKKRVIHKNKAARLKSRLATAISKLASTTQPKKKEKSAQKGKSKTKKARSTTTSKS